MSGLIPLETLFGNPQRASPRLSPDGRHLAYLAPDEGVLNVWVGPASGGAARPLTKDRGRGIRHYLWAEDTRSLLYLKDKNGDENWRIHQADIGTGATRDLTPLSGAQAQLVATDPEFPHEILVALNDRDPRAHDVYRLDLRGGERRLEAQNPGDVVGWLADARLRVRAAKAALADGGGELRVKDSGDSPWRTLCRWGPDDQVGAHGFTEDGRSLYVESSLDSDTTRLELWSLAGERRVLAHDPGADLGPVMLHPRRRHAEAAGFARQRRRWEVLDETLRADFSAIAAAGLGDFWIVSRDDADTRWIVDFNNDTRPGRYYLYKRPERALELLFSSRPALEAFELRPMEPVTIRARDGLELPAYLTRPQGPGPHPAVLLVHGGPWARDHWGYHPETQWLADRGWAVLQVNFRASTGFGKKFLHAGDREWGAKMQDDLTDAAAWACASGVADPRRLAIFGASYGGYAALAGAAFTPELFACAVDVVGPSNIATLIRSIPPYWEPFRRIFDLRVGNVDTEPDFLRQRSPLFSADRIRIPVLIAQGANDPRVKRAESEAIVAALRARGQAVEYLLFEDEGHGFARPENRLRFYAAAERFLAEHLAPPKTR